jgi:hypothetical protein
VRNSEQRNPAVYDKTPDPDGETPFAVLYIYTTSVYCSRSRPHVCHFERHSVDVLVMAPLLFVFLTYIDMYMSYR